MTPDYARRPYQEIVEHLLGTLTSQGILTDTAPGSVTRTLVEATAREFAELYARMNAVYEAGFLDTATGASLDQLVALIGLTRLPAETDIVEIRLNRDTRVSARVIIPAGARVTIDRQSGERVSYAVLDGDELRAGEASLVLTLRALPDTAAPDADLSITADDVALNSAALVQPIAGIAGLSLEGPSLRLGTNETDEALRSRARMAIAAAGGGTEKALEQALMDVDGVEGVRLRDAGDPAEGGVLLKPGEIEVILDGKPQILEQNRPQIEQAIARAKGPGIVARLGRTVPVPLSGKLVIRPASPTLAAAEALALVRACEELLAKTVGALEIGEGLHWNRLLAALMGLENMGDVLMDQSSFVTTMGGTDTTLTPPGDLSVEKTQRLVPGTGAQAFEVVLEDRPQVLVGVELAATIAKPSDAKADQLQAELTQLLIAYLETVDTTRPDASLTHAGLLAALSGAGGVTTFPEQITAETVSFTVLHESEGAKPTLRNTGATSVALSQNTVLRSADPAASVTWTEAGP